MIKHIVCFKLNENTAKEKESAKEILLSMTGKVPQIRAIEVGVDFLASARSYDLILQVTLDDRKALDEYQADEYHCRKKKKYIHEHTSASVAVDYEL